LVMAGFCCRALYKYERAIEIYKMIIDMFGENPWMDYYYGLCLGKMGNKKEALVWLNKALELGYEKPDDIEYYINGNYSAKIL